MRKTIITLAVAAVLAAATPALAGSYGYGGHFGPYFGYSRHGHFGPYFGYSRHGHFGGHHRFRHRGHRGHGAIVVGAVLGGLVLGPLITQSAARPAPRAPALRDCRATTGVGVANGRRAEFGGTMCYDHLRRPYVIRGSEYFIRYLN